MRQLFPEGFRTVVHNGKHLEVAAADGTLLHLVDIKWLATKLIAGEVMTMQDRAAAGAGLTHLLGLVAPFVPTHPCYYYLCDGTGRTLAPAFSDVAEARIAREKFPACQNIVPDNRGDISVGARFQEY